MADLEADKRNEFLKKEVDAFLHDKERLRKALGKSEKDFTAVEKRGLASLCDVAYASAEAIGGAKVKAQLGTFEGCTAFFRDNAFQNVKGKK